MAAHKRGLARPHAADAASAHKSGLVRPAPMPRLASAAGAGFSLRKILLAQGVPLPIETAAHYRTYRLPIETSRPADAVGALESGLARRVEPAYTSRPRGAGQAEPAPFSALTGGGLLMQVTAYSKRITPHGSRRPIECTTPHRNPARRGCGKCAEQRAG